MSMLAENERVIFVGQSVLYPGAMFDTLSHLPESRRLEFPVAEDLQVGFCTGLSLQGYLPVCCVPRMDFILRAMDQLVNHLDKLSAMSRGRFTPKVIIRTRVGSRRPLDAGPQHSQDHTEALRLMLKNVAVDRITSPEDIVLTYRDALAYGGSTLVVENLC